MVPRWGGPGPVRGGRRTPVSQRDGSWVQHVPCGKIVTFSGRLLPIFLWPFVLAGATKHLSNRVPFGRTNSSSIARWEVQWLLKYTVVLTLPSPHEILIFFPLGEAHVADIL